MQIKINKMRGRLSERQAGTSTAGQATVPTAKKTKTQVQNVLKPCRLALCIVHTIYKKKNITLVIWPSLA